VALLTSQADRDAEEFAARRERMAALVAELRERTAGVARGGGDEAMERHRSRGKLPARERIDRLVDPDSAFLELNALAAWDLYDGQAPSAGIVTGIGVVEGRECVIVANDATVKGGSYFPLTVKKHLRAQEVAAQNRLPCLYLVDSGGAFLPLQDEVFPDRDHFGRIFFNQAQMSARGIPQIAVVMGSCTAGGAYVPAMSDETVIVRGTGTIFIGGPPLVKAATGQDVTAEELGGADVHTRRSGVADHYATSDEHALAIARGIVRNLHAARPAPPWEVAEPEPPALDPSDLYGLIPEDFRHQVDPRELIARLVDG
jgi:acetyl-CoA carboxylase carboxyltransferase component